MEDLEKKQPDAPDIVYEEKNDKPTGRAIWWAISIAIVVLALVYFFFFMEDPAVGQTP